MALVSDQGDDHAVEVEEEHDEVEAELDEGFLEKSQSMLFPPSHDEDSPFCAGSISGKSPLRPVDGRSRRF